MEYFNNIPQLTEGQLNGEEQMSSEQQLALLQYTFTLLDFCGYFDDPQLNIHHDDFTAHAMERILNVIRTVKYTYYRDNPHRQ